MYVCIIMIYSKSKDQPGKVANPARGQLNRGNVFSLSTFGPESLVSRDGLGSPVPRQPAHLHTQAESGAYLRDSSRFPRRTIAAGGIALYGYTMYLPPSLFFWTIRKSPVVYCGYC